MGLKRVCEGQGWGSGRRRKLPSVLAVQGRKSMARVRLGAWEIGAKIELEAKRSTLWEIFDFP